MDALQGDIEKMIKLKDDFKLDEVFFDEDGDKRVYISTYVEPHNIPGWLSKTIEIKTDQDTEYNIDYFNEAEIENEIDILKAISQQTGRSYKLILNEGVVMTLKPKKAYKRNAQ